MTYYYIYKIICTAGSFKDHYYIGQRKCYCLPEEDSYKGSGVKIQKYYQKYPHDYKKEILCLCKDEDDLNVKEDFYVGDLYITDPLCLNLRRGGDMPGFSEETRHKLSEANKGKNKGKKLPEETRKKMSEAKKGKHRSEETRHKLSEANKGKHHSEETRAKISENHGTKRPEVRKKMSEAHKGKHHSEETRQKMSQTQKDRKWMNNGLQQKYVKANEVNLYIENGYSFGMLNR